MIFPSLPPSRPVNLWVRTSGGSSLMPPATATTTTIHTPQRPCGSDPTLQEEPTSSPSLSYRTRQRPREERRWTLLGRMVWRQRHSKRRAKEDRNSLLYPRLAVDYSAAIPNWGSLVTSVELLSSLFNVAYTPIIVLRSSVDMYSAMPWVFRNLRTEIVLHKILCHLYSSLNAVTCVFNAVVWCVVKKSCVVLCKWLLTGTVPSYLLPGRLFECSY